jgi:hypothetical protein
MHLDELILMLGQSESPCGAVTIAITMGEDWDVVGMHYNKWPVLTCCSYYQRVVFEM